MASAWTTEAEENFIELMKERKPLYDVTDTLYSNRIVKSRLWKEIEAEVHLTEKEMKKKWESLRTQYLRYKKLAPSGSAAAHLTGRQVWVLNRLQFLVTHTRRMSSVSNLSSQESMQNADTGSDNRFLTSMPRVEADVFTAAESANRFPTRVDQTSDADSSDAESDNRFLTSTPEAQYRRPSVPLEDSTLAEVPTAIASSPQSKPQQNCSNRKRCRRSGKQLSPHRTEEDKDIQSNHSIEEEEGAPLSDEEWVPENCSERKRNETTDLKKGRPNISSSVRGNRARGRHHHRSTPAMASVWTKEAEENFIELMKERKPLYDITDTLYSNRIVKSRLWKEIEAEVHLTEKEMKKKWESLRTQYLRYKKLAPSGSAAAHLTGRQVWVLNKLQFLEAHTRRMSSVSNLSSQESMQNADTGSDTAAESANRFPTRVDQTSDADSSDAESDNRFLTSTPEAQYQRPSVPLEDCTLAEVPTAIGGQLTCSTLSPMVPTLHLTSAFAWQVVQHCDVMHYGKVEELVQLVTEVVPHLLSHREKVDLLLGLSARPTPSDPCYEDLKTLVWEFISRLDKLLPLPDIKQTAELLSASPSLLKECGRLELEPDQLKTLFHHHTQQGNARKCSWAQSRGTIPSTASSPQSKPQQNCSNRKRCRRSGKKLSPHRTEEDKDRQSDHSIEEEEGAEGKQSDEEWVPENCSERKRNETTDLKKGRPNISSSVSRSAMASAWTEEEEEENFIELVKERKPLYDITDTLYSDRIVKSRLWKEIEAEVHLTEKEIKKKWESLRTQYLRYKKLAPSGSAAAHLTGRQVWVLNRLQFLEAHTRRMSSVSNLSSQESMQPASPSCLQFDKSDAPRVSSSWEKETIALLDLWGDESIQVALNNTLKNTHIYSLLSGKLADLGFHKSPSQCRNRVKNLTQKYRREKANGSSKHRGSTWFGLVDAVLGWKEVDLDGTPPEMSQDPEIPEKVDIPGVGHLKPQRPYTCTHCSRVFRRLGSLREHVRTHTGETCHMCHICGKTSIQRLVRHMLMHKGEKKYLCTQCGKKFLSPGELRLHTRTHTGEKPYSCKLCGKAFIAKSGLNLHVRSHTGEKPYSCTLCSKAFSSASHLKRHMFIHYDKKPFECFKCGKGFVQSFNLKLHIRTSKCIKEMGR